MSRFGSKRRGESLTDFVLRTACMEAEHALADKRHFTLSPEKWAAFIRVLDSPPVVKPELQRLFSEPSVLEVRRNSGKKVRPSSLSSQSS